MRDGMFVKGRGMNVKLRMPGRESACRALHASLRRWMFTQECGTSRPEVCVYNSRKRFTLGIGSVHRNVTSS